MEKETKKKNIKKPIIISVICILLVAVILIPIILVSVNSKDEDHNLFSKNLLAVKFDEGWGYINSKGKVKIEGQFDKAYPFADNGIALVSIGGSYGYINTDGEFVVNPIYSQATSFDGNSDYAVVKRNSKYGYVNKNGEEVIKCQFEEAYQFSYDLALVKIGGKYGFINSKGKFVINPIYDEAESFSNKKLTAVGKEVAGKMQYACISNKGKLLTDFMFDKLYISEKYVITFNGTYYGLCKTDLQPLFTTEYQIAGFPIELDSFENLNDHLIPFKDNSTYKYGYLNLKGQVVIDAKYDIIGNFYNDRALVKFDNKYGYIDEKGSLIVKNEYDIVKNFNDKYAVVGKANTNGNTLYGLINMSGALTTELKYYNLGNFVNGLCYFTTEDNQSVGYINEVGEVVIPQTYSEIGQRVVANDVTDDGYIVIRQGSNLGVINKKGDYIINPYLSEIKY